MKVFVAGATGALGKQLVPMLVANGHEVVGMTRTEAKRDQLRSVGAQPVVADALDADAVGRAVGAAEPDVIVHQLTAHRRRSTCDASIASSRSPTAFASRVPTTCCRRARRWRAPRRPEGSDPPGIRDYNDVE